MTGTHQTSFEKQPLGNLTLEGTVQVESVTWSRSIGCLSCSSIPGKKESFNACFA